MPSSPSPQPPDAASLHHAALAYLARYAATEAGLRRVLLKRIDRWAQTQPDRDTAQPVIAAARSAIDAVVAKLVGAGAISDAGFAEMRARSLLHTGRSRRAIQAALAAKGVPTEVARDAVGMDAAAELAAALILTRRRRIGGFRTTEPDDLSAAQRKEMALLARAGFSLETAQQALAMDPADAERRIHALRSDRTLDD